MLTGPRRVDLALIVAVLALVAVSLRPWWHDTISVPASTTPWRASTVWSVCLVLVAVAALAAVFVRGRTGRTGAVGAAVAAVVAVGSAAWAVVYTVGLYGVGPESGGWWTFESTTSPITVSCFRSARCGAVARVAFARDDLDVGSGVSDPTRSAFAGLTVMVLLALGIAWVAWRRVRASGRPAAG